MERREETFSSEWRLLYSRGRHPTTRAAETVSYLPAPEHVRRGRLAGPNCAMPVDLVDDNVLPPIPPMLLLSRHMVTWLFSMVNPVDGVDDGIPFSWRCNRLL